MIKFGVAGYPLAYQQTEYRNDRTRIFEWLRSLDLDAFEAQMTYGPRTSLENCRIIRELSQEYGIKVSVHAAYYIVLTSSDTEKVRRSMDTLKKTYELADAMGANVIVLHPGPYYASEPRRIYDTLAENLTRFFSEFGRSHIGLFLETAGKRGQLGSVDEILSLCNTVEGCFPCIDFGHVHARTLGTLAAAEAIDALFEKLMQSGFLSSQGRIHFHYTPIDYGPQGEITHKSIEDVYPVDLQQDLFGGSVSESLYHPRFERIVENMKRSGASFTVISETHNSQERGAMAMKAHYKSLG